MMVCRDLWASFPDYRSLRAWLFLVKFLLLEADQNEMPLKKRVLYCISYSTTFQQWKEVVKPFQIPSIVPKYPREHWAVTFEQASIQVFQVLQSHQCCIPACEGWEQLWSVYSLLVLIPLPWESITKQVQPPPVAAVCLLCVYLIADSTYPIQQRLEFP